MEKEIENEQQRKNYASLLNQYGIDESYKNQLRDKQKKLGKYFKCPRCMNRFYINEVRYYFE